MQSIKISNGFRFLLLLLWVGGTLAGCASPAIEPSQPEETAKSEINRGPDNANRSSLAGNRSKARFRTI